jgi:hypothetical protein
MEKYAGLAEGVASHYYYEHELWSQSWGGFSLEDILGVAYEGLCNAVLDYVERHKLPKKREKSYRVMSVELSESRERAYLKQSIENAITNFVIYEDRMHTVKAQAEMSGIKIELKAPRLVPLEEAIAQEEEQAEFAPLEREAGKYKPLIDTFREFAETLPVQERTAFFEMLKDVKNRCPRTPKEIARSLRVSERYYCMLRSSINEHFVAWHLREYYGQAA